jgi:hypothetical protein
MFIGLGTMNQKITKTVHDVKIECHPLTAEMKDNGAILSFLE